MATHQEPSAKEKLAALVSEILLPSLETMRIEEVELSDEGRYVFAAFEALAAAVLELDWTTQSAKTMLAALDRFSRMGDPRLLIWYSATQVVTGRPATSDEFNHVLRELEQAA